MPHRGSLISQSSLFLGVRRWNSVILAVWLSKVWLSCWLALQALLALAWSCDPRVSWVEISSILCHWRCQWRLSIVSGFFCLLQFVRWWPFCPVPWWQILLCQHCRFGVQWVVAGNQSSPLPSRCMVGCSWTMDTPRWPGCRLGPLGNISGRFFSFLFLWLCWWNILGFPCHRQVAVSHQFLFGFSILTPV